MNQIDLALDVKKESETGLFSNPRLLLIKSGFISYYSKKPKDFIGNLTINSQEMSGRSNSQASYPRWPSALPTLMKSSKKIERSLWNSKKVNWFRWRPSPKWSIISKHKKIYLKESKAIQKMSKSLNGTLRVKMLAWYKLLWSRSRPIRAIHSVGLLSLALWRILNLGWIGRHENIIVEKVWGRCRWVGFKNLEITQDFLKFLYTITETMRKLGSVK